MGDFSLPLLVHFSLPVTMNEAEFHAEKMYLLCLGTAKTMLKKGVISEEEFTKIDTMLLEKYKPTLSTLLSGKPLI